VRQTEVQSQFLHSFGALYPNLAFRAMRRLADRAYAPYDLVLRVALGRGGVELDLLCIALNDGHPQEVKRFLHRITQEPPTQLGEEATPVLIAPYFTEEAQALCRAAGVGFFDLAGNAGLDTPRAFLEISGKANQLARKRQVGEPFQGVAERVVRRLLLQPEKRLAMRALANASQSSLALTSMATSALVETGVAAKSRGGLSLLDPGNLLNAWAEHYDLRRNPFQIWRSTLNVDELQTQLAALRPALGDGWALTLWSGAHCLLPDTDTPPHLALYWQGDVNRLEQALHIYQNTGKTLVFVFQPYDPSLLWEPCDTERRLLVVNPLQLYLDLGSGAEQELQLAQRVRARRLPW